MDLELILRTAKKHLDAGELPGNEGHFDIACFLYKKAIEINPKDFLAYGILGYALISLERHEEAIPNIKKAINLNPKHPASYINLGAALHLLGKNKEAIPNLEKAIELDPKNSVAYNNLGAILNLLGKPKEAIPNLEKAIELDPKYSLSYGNRGNSYRLLGDLKSARQDYEKALSLFEQKTNPNKNDYKRAIRAERELVKLGITKQGTIEKEALKKGIVTKDELSRAYKYEK